MTKLLELIKECLTSRDNTGYIGCSNFGDEKCSDERCSIANSAKHYPVCRLCYEYVKVLKGEGK